LNRRNASFGNIAERFTVLGHKHPTLLGPDQSDEASGHELSRRRTFPTGGGKDVNGGNHHMGPLAWHSVNRGVPALSRWKTLSSERFAPCVGFLLLFVAQAALREDDEQQRQRSKADHKG
jgi:hypothetical protein